MTRTIGLPPLLARSITRAVALCVLATTLFTQPAGAARKREPFSRAGAPATAFTRHAVRPQQVTVGPALVMVNQAWTGNSNGTIETVGANNYTFGTDAFATIQAGIDAVQTGGTVDVLPGPYMETAPGSVLYDASGPYQFGVFVGQAKGAITVQGVDAAGNPITSAASVATTVNYDATNDFGTSGFFIEADGVTFSGLGIGSQQGPDGTNKTFEIIGDNFTLKNCNINDNGAGSVYIDNWRATMSTSHVQSYAIQGDIFQDANTLDIASGPGTSGPASGRVISGNSFTMSDVYNSISFSGTSTPGVPWYVYPVGGAVITGNTFTNTNPAGTIIKARGTYDNSQFDWASYWNTNTFNRATCEGIAPPGNLRAYSYSVFTNARRIEATIQGEVDEAVNGDVVLVHGGTYVEQVVVNGTSITIQGAGRASTTVQSPATLPVTFTTGGVNHPILLLEHASDIEVKDLTVDGQGLGAGNYRFHGVDFWDAGGKVLNCDIVRVRENPFNGNQHGVAIYTFNDTGGPYSLEVGGCNISDFQKNAMALSGNGLTVNVHDCTVTGQGPTALNAQNGIQIGFGAGGSVTHCTLSGMYYTGGSTVATGLLMFGPATVNVTGGSITGCQYAVYYEDVSGTISGTGISTPTAAGGLAPLGMEIFNDLTSMMAMTAGPASAANPGARRDAATAGARVPPRPDAVRDEVASRGARPLATASSPMTVAVTGGCSTGPGGPAGNGSAGMDIYSSGAPLQVSVTGAEISAWDYGMGDGGDGGVSVDANHNSIAGNLTAGYDFYGPAAATNLAASNWWGNAGGPGVGGANPVLGAGVVSSPWLIANTDANPGCGFSPSADNTISPGPAPSCISVTNTCVTIPVNISRTTSDNIRGYSVALQLSSNLDLCSGPGSITEGTYLSSVSGTLYQVTNHGAGSYTVDCAILGLPCGATAATGNLFNVNVKKNGPDGTGTLTLTSVTARDCDNNPVAVTAGSPLNVTIDTGTPATISNVVAAQVRTGNGGSGLTGITVSFTAPGDAVSTQVYRAPFGGGVAGSYPAYTGSAPTAPSYPPGAPWVLTSLTATGVDHPPVRGYWYYVVFTHDACGNVSAVSNVSNGGLDYHLGDVSDGITVGHGNNAVFGEDISLLGAHYGFATPVGFEYLDYGPTTNSHVDGRPVPDGQVNFEELILLAINYNQVSKPGLSTPAPAPADQLSTDVSESGGVLSVRLQVQGAGDIQGVSTRLAWNSRVVEPTGFAAGSLLEQQGGVSFSPSPGTVDAALLGVRDMGLAGSGTLATVTFRRIAEGDPGISLARVDARDAQNQPVQMGVVNRNNGAGRATRITGLAPNPFRSSTTVQYSLSAGSQVELAVFSVDGVRIRTLVAATLGAGDYTVTWDGRNEAGQSVGQGVFYARLRTAQGSFSRAVTLLR